MAAATAFISINIWTGAPVLALWIGSQVTEDIFSFTGVVVVLVALAMLAYGMGLILTWLSNSYDELIGRPRIERRPAWLRSMRAEPEGHVSSRVGVTALERIVMASVYCAVIGLLVWLVFFAGSMVPSELRGPG